MIIHHYISTNVLGEEAKDYWSSEISSVGLTVEQKLELEASLAIKVEREKAQLALQQEHEKAQLAAQLATQQAQLAAQQEKEKYEMERTRMELEASLAMKVEEEKAKIINVNVPPFDLAKNIKLVPPFLDFDPDDYFRVFEETANNLKWPREQWVWLLKPKLTGKAAKSARHLENTSDYEVVKQAILDGFSITEEGYRQAFRDLTKKSIQTYLEFASEKSRAFLKWFKSAGVSTLDQLVNLMVLEEFKRKLPLSIMLHIEDRQEKDLKKAASRADTYSLVHKSNTGKKAEGFVKPGPGKNFDALDDSAKSKNDGSTPLKCSYCKKEGHKIQNCKDPKCRSSEQFRSSFTQPSVKTDTESQSQFQMSWFLNL